MKRLKLILILAAVFFLNPVHLKAEIYRCTDRNGTVSFKAKPGPGCELLPASVGQDDSASGVSRSEAPRIALDFKETDIRNILKLMAEIGGINIIWESGVTGLVSIRTEEIPFYEALGRLLEPNPDKPEPYR